MIFMLMAATATFGADDSKRMELPKSGSVILTASEDKNVTRYVLSLKTSAGTEIRLSSHEVPRSDSPPSEGRALLSCDENAEVVVVLMNVNDFAMILIQYDLDWKVVKEYRIFAPNILQEKGIRGGKLGVIAPNQITLSAPNREPLSWSVADGKLIGEGSAAVQLAQSRHTGGPSSESTTVTMHEHSTSSTAWSIIAVLIVAAIGLLCLLLKRRSLAQKT